MTILKKYYFYYILILVAVALSTIDIKLIFSPLFLINIGNHYLNYLLTIKKFHQSKLLKYKNWLILFYILNYISIFVLYLTPLLNFSFVDVFILKVSFFTMFFLNIAFFPMLNYYSIKNHFKNKFILFVVVIYISNFNILNFMLLLPLIDENNEN